MALTRRPDSPFWQYEFQVDGRRYRGSTETTSRKSAKAFEARQRAALKAAAAAERTIADSGLDIALADAAGRYFQDRGQHTARPDDLLAQISRLSDLFGADTRIADISTAIVAEAIARRRLPDDNGRMASNATVNRTLTHLLRRILRHAEDLADARLPRPPQWRKLVLAEPREIVREASIAEEDALFAAAREDYRPILRFALLSGLRMSSLVAMDWDNTHLEERRARVPVKSRNGARSWHAFPLTGEMVALLALERGKHREAVFCYRVQPPRGGIRPVKAAPGTWMPITREGVKTEWRRLRKRAKIESLRFHDLRHTAATRLLRSSNNLKLTQRLLGHSDIATTSKYAHASMDDVLEAMENEARVRTAARTESVPESPTEPPTLDTAKASKHR